MIQNKTDILEELNSSFTELSSFINSLNQNAFEYMPDGKWSAGQQLDHLIKAIRPINMALYLPKWMFPLIFGKMNREGRSYDELKLKYDDKLALGGTASSPFIPPKISFNKKDQKIRQYKSYLKTILKHIEGLSENDLDSILLPHPLLGKINLREMMFFTIFHTHHHLNIVKGHPSIP